jgi:myo-inositol-1(or 4)-monophosphatase
MFMQCHSLIQQLSDIGTVNYIHLAPFYCVSIAFLWNGEPIIGAVNAPFLQQL